MSRRSGKKARAQQNSKPQTRQAGTADIQAGSPRPATSSERAYTSTTPRQAGGVGRLSGRRGLLIASLVILLGLGLPTIGRQIGTLLGYGSAPQEGLVFVRDNRLLMIDAEGERVLANAPDEAEISDPVASPDGQKLAYTVLRGWYGQPDWGGSLYVLDVPASSQGGTEPRLLVESERSGDSTVASSWSPDGQSLLVTYHESVWEGESYQGTRPILQELRIATGQRRTIARGARHGSWSPDNGRIAYVKGDAENADSLWTSRPDGSEPRQIVGPGEYAALGRPWFSPVSGELLFSAVPKSAADSQPRQTRASWLPDLEPAVARAHGVPWDLWAWSDGRQPRKITNLGEDLLSVAWSPDGSRIAVVTDGGLYQMDANGEDLQRIELQVKPAGLAWLDNQQ